MIQAFENRQMLLKAPLMGLRGIDAIPEHTFHYALKRWPKKECFCLIKQKASVNSIHDCSLSSESSFIFTAGAQ